MNKSVVWIFGMIVLSTVVLGQGVDINDSCYNQSTWTVNGDLTEDLKIVNSCTGGDYILWTEDVNMTTFGDVTEGEVEIANKWMDVDSSLRPDLDARAELHFVDHQFASAPNVLVDGSTCSSCNLTYGRGEIVVEVPGFSNYSLTYKQEFEVLSDDNPELKGKVYQTVDLGNSYRDEEFSCVVQIFGRSSSTNDWVLVQANPERKAVGNVLGDPDTNQPESKGYFETVNGVSNVYFRGGLFDNLAGYSDFQYVARCSNNQTALTFEEPITTTYSPLGRTATARGIWLTDGNNAYYLVFFLLGGLFSIWILGGVFVSIKRAFGR